MTADKTFTYKPKGGLQLLEEALYCLKSASISTHVFYLLGTMPFIMGFLFFWADMSKNAFARDHLITASLAITILFIWMRCFHVVFVNRLKEELMDLPPSKWNSGRILKMICIQTALFPWTFIVLPLAGLAMLPLAWACAFFENVAIVGNGDNPSVLSVIKRSWELSKLWPGQNHVGLLLISLLSLVIMINIAAAALLLPGIFKMLLGIETMFNQSFFFLFNTTFFVVLVALTYLCTAPLAKAFFVLRFYHGRSLRTGEDILVELRQVKTKVSPLLVLLVLFFSLTLSPLQVNAEKNANTDHPTPPVEKPVIKKQELDASIDDVMKGLEYSWRVPPEREREHVKKGFTHDMLTTLSRWYESFTDAVRDFFQWLRDLFPQPEPKEKQSPGTTDWTGLYYIFLYLMLAIILCFGAILIKRIIQNKSRRNTPHALPPKPVSVPDLEKEEIVADELPSRQWRNMAEDLFAKGQYRLGIRALFLATLALLSEKELLSLAGYKSNRDYLHELSRRSHAYPDLLDNFSRNTKTYESVWYGEHHLNEQDISRFTHANSRIESIVQ